MSSFYGLFLSPAQYSELSPGERLYIEGVADGDCRATVTAVCTDITDDDAVTDAIDLAIKTAIQNHSSTPGILDYKFIMVQMSDPKCCPVGKVRKNSTPFMGYTWDKGWEMFSADLASRKPPEYLFPIANAVAIRLDYHKPKL